MTALYRERSEQTKYWLPLVFFELYLNFSVFLFAFGPWPWPVSNALELYAYLLIAHFLLFIGYWSGLRSTCGRSLEYGGADSKWLTVSLFTNVVLLLPTCYSRTGNLLPDIMLGITSPGDAYKNAVDRSSAGGWWVLIEYVRIIIAPVLALAFPFVIATWKNRTGFEKFTCAFIVIFNVAIYVSMGTNKIIFDTVLLLPWLIALAILSKHLVLSKRLFSFLSLAGLGGLFLAFVFFGYGQTQREGGVATGRTFGPPIYIDTDKDNWLTFLLPDTLQIYVESLARYLSQGYYALSRALLLDPDTTYGFGHSIFLTRNAESIFGIAHLSSMTYPARLEQAEGWGALTLWHSIYPWLASDIGFIGVLLIVYLIGKCFAMAWVYAVDCADKASILLFSYFVLILFYFPANNQVMQNGEPLIGFASVLVFWILRTVVFYDRKQLMATT